MSHNWCILITVSITDVYSTSCLLNMISTYQCMDRALAEKPVSQLAIARTLKHCHHYHLVQVAIGPPHLQIEYLCRLVACNDVTRRHVKSRPLHYCSMFVLFTFVLQLLYTATLTTTTYIYHHHMQPPPHSASCTSPGTVFAPVVGKKNHHQRKSQQVMTTTCASGVFAPVDGRKTPPAQGAKVRTSIRTNWSGMQQCLMQRQPPYHRPNQDQHGCRWSA